MLHRLTISNYAIIKKLDIEFCESMNIITGETGAGKSILLGALKLILGERADTRVLYDQNEKCVVEAHFEITNKALESFFTTNELDFEAHTIIRREINQSGKSRAFINDTPVTLQLLKVLGEQLVNLHSQHETLELSNAGFQLNVIDALAKNMPLLASYQNLFTAYRADLSRLKDLEEQFRNSNAELDYLQFQLAELDEAGLENTEQEVLEAEQNTLSNIEEIQSSLLATINLLSEGEVSVIDQLNEIQSKLKGVKNFNKNIQELYVRIGSTSAELKDIAKEFEHIQSATSPDPERLADVTSRLSTIYRLHKKHNTSLVEQLLSIKENLQQKIAMADNRSAEIQHLKEHLKTQQGQLMAVAEQMHQSREKVLREFQNNVTVLLAKVGMPNASFKVTIQKTEQHQLNKSGFTEIRFLFSANKGFAPLELKEVASGGELSRLMLCIKSLIAGAGNLATLVFDEIDNGISGEVALKVSEIMKKLSRNHQLIAITHLPQIARTADSHLYIYKKTENERTYTYIKKLQGDERITEIAKMLGGDKVSDASLANARELIAS